MTDFILKIQWCVNSLFLRKFFLLFSLSQKIVILYLIKRGKSHCCKTQCKTQRSILKSQPNQLKDIKNKLPSCNYHRYILYCNQKIRGEWQMKCTIDEVLFVTINCIIKTIKTCTLRYCLIFITWGWILFVVLCLY